MLLPHRGGRCRRRRGISASRAVVKVPALDPRASPVPPLPQSQPSPHPPPPKAEGRVAAPPETRPPAGCRSLSPNATKHNPSTDSALANPQPQQEPATRYWRGETGSRAAPLTAPRLRGPRPSHPPHLHPPGLLGRRSPLPCHFTGRPPCPRRSLAQAWPSRPPLPPQDRLSLTSDPRSHPAGLSPPAAGTLSPASVFLLPISSSRSVLGPQLPSLPLQAQSAYGVCVRGVAPRHHVCACSVLRVLFPCAPTHLPRRAWCVCCTSV